MRIFINRAPTPHDCELVRAPNLNQNHLSRLSFAVPHPFFPSPFCPRDIACLLSLGVFLRPRFTAQMLFSHECHLLLLVASNDPFLLTICSVLPSLGLPKIKQSPVFWISSWIMNLSLLMLSSVWIGHSTAHQVGKFLLARPT